MKVTAQRDEYIAAMQHLLAVARRDIEPDVVIGGGRVFNVFTREWQRADVAIAGEFIAGVGDFAGGVLRIDAAGAAVVPGMIDAHVHLESSKLMFDEFARIALRCGTTTVVADPHEIANVLGVRGVEWMADACAELPLDVVLMAPSCVPASPLESPYAAFGPAELAGLVAYPGVYGIGEMMNFPGVVGGLESELAKLATPNATHADGHAPGVVGSALDAYVATGITSDHEAVTVDEAVARRRRGMWTLIREASNARNLEALIPAVQRFGTDLFAFCTDDREPHFLHRHGMIDQMCRKALANGLSVEDTLVLATVNGARAHGLRDRGALVPGRIADVLVINDLDSFVPHNVVKRGNHVVRDATLADVGGITVPEWARDTVSIGELATDAFRIDAVDGDVRIIGIVPDQLLTTTIIEPATVNGDECVAAPARDIAKIAVVERHHATGRVGVGFVRGFTLQRGAFATTVAHDAHNIVVVGVNDEDMRACVERIAEIGGGVVVTENGSVVAEAPLEVAGLLSTAPVEELVAQIDACDAAVVNLGVTLDSPLMALSFLALSVIPELKITDHGLVDVGAQQVVQLAASPARV